LWDQPNEDQAADLTLGASFELVELSFNDVLWCGRIEQHSAQCESFPTSTISEKTELADTHEAAGKDVQQKTPDELCRCQGHDLRPIAISIVFVFETDAASFDRQDSAIRNRDSVRIPSQILQDLFGPAKGRLHKNDPWDAPRLLTQGFEYRRPRESSHLAIEVQPAFPE
jgi:hypothetical protein